VVVIGCIGIATIPDRGQPMVLLGPGVGWLVGVEGSQRPCSEEVCQCGQIKWNIVEASIV
jgi:hypothetical protein